MTKKSILLSLPVCVLIAMLAAFLFVSPAFAQDEMPPEVVPTESPAEVFPAEVLPTEVAPVEELPVEPVPVEEAPAAEPSLAEALDEADVVLADFSGQPLTLASDSAESLINNGDPFFTSGGVIYRFMEDCGSLENCTSALNPIQAAIDVIGGGLIPTDGTLYFEANSTYDVDWVEINSVTGLKKLQGNVDTGTGLPTVTINLAEYFGIYNQMDFSITGFNFFGNTSGLDGNWGALDIWGNTGTLTLTDIVASNLGTEGVGIAIGDHTGAVTLQNVNSSGNAGGGADIDNFQGSIAPVTVKNSRFNDNGGNSWVNGLGITTRGTLLLDGVSVNGNGSSGGIFSATSIWGATGAITIKNSTFDDNYNSGIANGYPSNGAILLDNVTANNNRHYIDIDNEPGGAGIWMFANGNFTANNVTANGNKHQGMMADTCFSVESPVDSGNFVCTTTVIGNVTITNSEFSNNFTNSQGLYVDAKGAISLTNVDASNNRGIDRDPASPDYGNPTFTTRGASLNNISTTTAYPITVKSSSFDGNSNHGLEIFSKGAVTLYGVSGSFNDGDGTHIEAKNSAVSVKNSVFDGNDTSDVNFEIGDGLFIQGNTATLDNVQTENNGQSGIYSENNTSFSGLHLHSQGNQWSGISVNTCLEYDDGDALCDNPGAGTVTISTSSSSGNGGVGYEVLAKGAVTVTNVYGGDNGGDGINIDNTKSPLVSTVTLTKLDLPRNDNGVFVVAKGPVTLNNFKTYEGRGDGVNIDNCALDEISGKCTGSGAVTLAYASGLHNETNNNAGYGYSILSNGAVTVTNVNSRNNGKDGGYINNSVAGTAATVTVNKVGPVNEDNGYWENGSVVDTAPSPTDFGGLRILSRGAVSVLRTISDNNAGPGLVINNVPSSTTLPGVPVTINSGDFSDNDSNGLEITSRGAVSLTSVWTMSNRGFGAKIDNDPGISTMAGAAVTVTDSGFNGNYVEDLNSDENGLKITSKGLVTLTNISANGNDGIGTEVNNKSGTAGVTINATAGKGNSFNNNLLDGLKIETNGAVTLTNIRATDNILYDGVTGDILAGGYGVNIDNTGGFGVVTIKQLGGWGGDGYWTDGNVFSGNNGRGLSITTKGTVNVTFFEANNNKDTGMYIYAFDGPGTMTVSGAANSWDNLSYNWGDGLSIESKGSITVTNIKANDNGGYGAFFNNRVSMSIAGVTLNALAGNGNEFQSNGIDGLRILTNGPVTLTNIYTSGNKGLIPEPDATPTGYGVHIYNAALTNSVTLKQVGSWGGRDFWTEGNVFSDNVKGGLWIKTKGVVTVPFYQAKSNGGTGIFIDAQGGVGAVTVSGTNNYFQNLCFNETGYGLDITAKGNISASNFDACLNEAGGATFTNNVPGGTGSVTLTNADFLDNFGSGVYVRSAGAVTWKNGTTYNNWGLGADIDNTFGIAKAVSLTNITSNNNQETGLKILSNGLVTITDSVSESNSVNNKYLDYYDEWADNLGNNVEQAWWFDGLMDEEVTIQVLSDRLDPTLYLTDMNGYYIDSTWTVGSDGFAELTFTVPEDGVFQIVVGAMNSYPGWGYNIKIYEGLYDPDRIFNFQESLANGIYVDNTTSSTNAGVTITNTNGAWNSNNSDTNVVIKSKGAVSLLDMYISDSGHGGLDIDNSGAPVGLTPGVTLSWMGIDNNGGNGVSINTKGAVTITGVGTTGNRGYGVTAVTSGAFTVTAPTDAWNYFDNNLLGGLNVEAGGIITVNRAYAGKNGQVYGMGPIKDSYGIKLISTNGLGTSPVTLTNIWVYENTLDGVKIITKGAVTVTGLSTVNNKHNGLNIDQSLAENSSKAISLNKITASNNRMDGILVNAKGNITLNMLDAFFNDQNGAALNNNLDGSTGIVTVLNTMGDNTVVGNGGIGLKIQSLGAVTVTGLETIYNSGGGLKVVNTNTIATIKPAITLNSIISRVNSGDGIYTESSGVITINNSWSASNNGDGIGIKSDNNVFINNTSVIKNDLAGIRAVRNDAVVTPTPTLKLTNSTWFGNLRNDPVPADRNLMYAGWYLSVM